MSAFGGKVDIVYDLGIGRLSRSTGLSLKKGPTSAATLLVGAAIMVAPMLSPALAADQVHDEIQVYNAEIAEVGQWTIQQHLNYAVTGQQQSEIPGGFTSNHALQGTPEFAYGITDWWEIGFYLPFAAESSQLLSNGAKIRNLFVVPDAAKRNFFYGINFELSYNAPHWEPSRYSGEIRPIVGVHLGRVDLILNPILDTQFDGLGKLDFAPAARVAYNLNARFAFALEYYGDYGPLEHFKPASERSQSVFAVVDFGNSSNGIEFGVGKGLTSASDNWVIKLMLMHNL